MAEKGEEKKEEFFQPLNAETGEVTEIESLCVKCMKQGVTKLMMTKIPFFREVIISSFECPHCHLKNSELGSAMEVAAQGVEFDLKVKDGLDLNRLVVKSDYAAIRIPELDLEIPQQTQKGEVTTIEGILNRVATGLRQDQDRRKMEHIETYQQIEAYLRKIEECLELKRKFSLHLMDISGNSFIANRPDVLTVDADPNLKSRKFDRTAFEEVTLGLRAPPGDIREEEEEEEEPNANIKDEVLQMKTNCPDCGAECFTKMKVTDIPYFKEVIIMATDCEKCGSRTNEVKSSGGIEEKGKRIKLNVKTKDDLSRDVLKTDTCHVKIPELDLEAGSGAIIGKFTTVEGLLVDIKKQFSEDNPLIGGDSVDPEMKQKMERLCSQLTSYLSGETPFTIVLDDPAGNCYIQNIYAPDEDPEMEIVDYERTFEQNEELGLNDMKV